ncbi:uncharacterized protein [Macrobrachium rosenbergii]|uniref:uncharacterized protein n=1 Tax=Macrobrachium rosenbergii TaxID=79674 RepID=UPI0034D47431
MSGTWNGVCIAVWNDASPPSSLCQVSPVWLRCLGKQHPKHLHPFPNTCPHLPKHPTLPSKIPHPQHTQPSPETSPPPASQASSPYLPNTPHLSTHPAPQLLQTPSPTILTLPPKYTPPPNTPPSPPAPSPSQIHPTPPTKHPLPPKYTPTS